MSAGKTSRSASPAEAEPTSATRLRIVEAARCELVAHGVAGARVDRIARRAKTSKERIYFYFKDKAELVDEVAQALAHRFHESVTVDPDDLDGFTRRIFDYYIDNPDDARLWLWLYLENSFAGDLPQQDFRLLALEERVESFRAAQRAGIIAEGWNPVLVLNLISSLGMSRVIAPDYIHQLAAKESGVGPEAMIELHRQALREVSHRIFAEPPSHGPGDADGD